MPKDERIAGAEHLRGLLIAAEMSQLVRGHILEFMPKLIDLRILEHLVSRGGREEVVLTDAMSDQLGIPREETHRQVVRLADRGLVNAKGDELRATSNGVKYWRELEHARNANRQGCCDYIAGKLKCSPQVAQRGLDSLETWFRACRPATILAVLAKAEYVIDKVPASTQPVIRAVWEVPKKELADNPIFCLGVGYVAANFVLQTRAEGEVRAIVLDTNTILALVSRRSTMRDLSLNTILGVLDHTPSVKIVITRRTLTELGGVFDAIERRCHAWEVRSRFGTERKIMTHMEQMRAKGLSSREEVTEAIHRRISQETEVSRSEVMNAIELLTPLGTEYYTRHDAPPTFRDFKTEKLAEVIGTHRLHGLPENVRWAPEIIDTDEIIARSECEDASAKIRSECEKSKWDLRKELVEEHDIHLLLFADKWREKAGGRAIVWTHHKLLPVLATIIGVAEKTVVVGPLLMGLSSFEPDLLHRYILDMFLRTSPGREEIQGIADVLERLKAEGNLPSVETLVERLLAGLSDQPAPARQEESWDSSLPAIDSDVRCECPDEFTIPQQESDDLAGWLDISVDWGDSPGGHGVLPLKIFWGEGNEENSGGRAMQWQISPHAVTHVDLPWAIDPTRLKERPKRFTDLQTHEAQQIISRIAAPHVVDATFIDLTDFAENAGLMEDGKPTTLLFSKSEDELLGLVKRLRIDADTILARTSGVNLSDKLVVLHTGWAALFMPRGDDLRSSCWEGRHAWLMHPWLDEMAVSTLCDRRIAGIAIDAPMADCPMYVAHNLSLHDPQVVAVAKRIIGSQYVPDVQPAHSRVLGSSLLMMESLFIPTEVRRWYEQPRSSLATRVFMMGLHLHLIPDAIPVKLLLRMPRNDM